MILINKYVVLGLHGALDGTHIAVTVPEEDQMRYRGRKGIPTINVILIYNSYMT